MAEQRQTAWVVVLGDFGRSPRMQYHALSLVDQAGVSVHVLAQGGTEPFPAVAHHDHIHIHYIPDTCLVQAYTSPQIVPPDSMKPCMSAFEQPFLLPPTIPTMAVCSLAAWWHAARLIHDWHNFGYTLMALNLGRRHWLVETAERYERRWASHSYASLCVSAAMQEELRKGWGVRATLCYDRPPPHFQPTPLEEAHELLQKLEPMLAQPLHLHDCVAAMYADARDSATGSSTILTTRGGRGRVKQRTDRPALVISSTSWTPDEDFGVLLEAVRLYDLKARKSPGKLPALLVVVTGKGPQRAGYLARLRTMDLRRCAFRTAWLEAADYPRLLGAADLGVCLHTSSSGLDLPMKVLDMFGCGLPMCAMDYQCIGELVEANHSGLLFKTPKQLAAQLEQLLSGLPGSPGRQLRHMRRVVAEANDVRWDDTWRETVLPVVRKALRRPRQHRPD